VIDYIEKNILGENNEFNLNSLFSIIFIEKIEAIEKRSTILKHDKQFIFKLTLTNTPCTLNDLINLYFYRDASIKCPQYKYLLKTNKFLIIALNRYDFDLTATHATKLNTPVTIPHLLDIQLLNLHNHKVQHTYKYELQSIIVHIGNTTNSGHYISIVNSGDKFIICNDADISRNFNYAKNYKSKDAYLLFYKICSVDSTPKLTSTTYDIDNNFYNGSQFPYDETFAKSVKTKTDLSKKQSASIVNSVLNIDNIYTSVDEYNIGNLKQISEELINRYYQK
jgi:hypothetical protein